ncbi:MAG TPA: IPTL-CTERM sorting domain-containing protein, partial [Thermoanaerobaculia bacterium]|nr:IPTL-CTERM sorting domain-containing protein [Thermoanaerobaculia bacterium]
MNVLTSRGIRSAFALLVMTVGLAPAASAVTSEFSILLNTDVSPASGCDVVTADGTFQGVEQILITTVDTTGTSTAQVSQIERQVCVDPVTDTFGPRILVDGTDRPVGVGLGTGGSDVVETFFPLSALPPFPPGPQIVRLGVTGENLTTGGLEDALLTGTPGNQPIQLVLAGLTIGDIPTLSEWSLIFLGLMLAVAAVVMLKRRSAVALLLALVFLAGAGIAWAAVSDL